MDLMSRCLCRATAHRSRVFHAQLACDCGGASDAFLANTHLPDRGNTIERCVRRLHDMLDMTPRQSWIGLAYVPSTGFLTSVSEPAPEPLSVDSDGAGVQVVPWLSQCQQRLNRQRRVGFETMGVAEGRLSIPEESDLSAHARARCSPLYMMRYET
jgi:hypothetical protein